MMHTFHALKVPLPSELARVGNPQVIQQQSTALHTSWTERIVREARDNDRLLDCELQCLILATTSRPGRCSLHEDVHEDVHEDSPLSIFRGGPPGHGPRRLVEHQNGVCDTSKGPDRDSRLQRLAADCWVNVTKGQALTLHLLSSASELAPRHQCTIKACKRKASRHAVVSEPACTCTL